jgi:hypothetical protein
MTVNTGPTVGTVVVTKTLLPGWESALFSVVGSLLNSSAMDPATKSDLQGVISSVVQVGEDAPALAAEGAETVVGLGATAAEAAAPAAAPVIGIAAGLGEAAIGDLVSGIVSGFESVFVKHNANTIAAIGQLTGASAEKTAAAVATATSAS